MDLTGSTWRFGFGLSACYAQGRIVLPVYLSVLERSQECPKGHPNPRPNHRDGEWRLSMVPLRLRGFREARVRGSLGAPDLWDLWVSPLRFAFRTVLSGRVYRC